MRYFSAMRTASNAASKQWLGERAATIGSGASPWRPYIASSRSACSVLVGRPVDGPPRCTSTISSGSSRLTARPIASDLRSTPGPARGGDAEVPGERSTDRDADRGDLVLGLQRAHAEVLVRGELVQDVGRRRDRVRRVEHRAACADCDAARRPYDEREVAGDVAVVTGREACRRDRVRDGRTARRSRRSCSPALNAARFAALHHLAARELLLDPLDGRLDRARVHPRHEPEGEEVLRPLGVARLHAELLGRLERHRGHRDLDDLVRRERAVLERVGLVAGLVEVALLEGVGVDDAACRRARARRCSPSAPPGSSPRARRACRRA